MSKKSKELRGVVSDVLDEFRISMCEFDFTGGGHQRVRFRYAGEKLTYIFPATHSDVMSIGNTRAGLRRVIRCTAAFR